MKKLKLLLSGVAPLMVVGSALAFTAPAKLSGALKCIITSDPTPIPCADIPERYNRDPGNCILTGMCCPFDAPPSDFAQQVTQLCQNI